MRWYSKNNLRYNKDGDNFHFNLSYLYIPIICGTFVLILSIKVFIEFFKIIIYQ